MPFLIRPPLDSAIAKDLVPRLFEPNQDDRSMLVELREWGWRISQHDYHDETFIEALTQSEKGDKEWRRYSHANGDELIEHPERPSLEDVWIDEMERTLMVEAYEDEERIREAARAAEEAAAGEAKKYISVF